MIDFDFENKCRICLGEDAKYNLFNNNNIHDKIFICFNEKIENIEGYPRKICSDCNHSINTICEFKQKYQETTRILASKVTEVKVEYSSDNDFDAEELTEIIVDKVPKVEKRPPEEILESLKEITIKKVNTENEDTQCQRKIHKVVPSKQNKPCNRQMKNKKRGRPPKTKKSSHLLKKPSSDRKPDIIKRLGRPKKVKEEVIERRKLPDRRRRKLIEIDVQDQYSDIESDVDLQELKIKKEEKIKKEITEPVPRLCDKCGETFTKYADLIAHRKTHKTKQVYECKKCDKVYKVKATLKHHNLSFHEKIRNAVCDTCGRAFYKNETLRKHIECVHEHVSKIQEIYKCKYCDKVYRYKKGQIIHERAVHTGERPAVCSVCQSAFYDECYLREHMRLHTGDTPFKCPVCNKGYAQRGNMKSHMRNHRISDLGPEVLEKLKPSYLKFLRP